MTFVCSLLIHAARSSDTLGLLSYPVLQAADILLFRAGEVPVGEDQRQHLELARDLATAFNSRWGCPNLLRPPRALLAPVACRIMSLRDPACKMSKSDPRGVLLLDDSPDVIRAKIAKAVTDSHSGLAYDPKERPALAALLRLHSALSDQEPAAIAAQYTQKVDFKAALSDLVISTLDPMRKALAQISLADAEAVMKTGAERARAIAEPNLQAAMRACKLRS
jgi:tryptophanyl-tRNA synthetase